MSSKTCFNNEDTNVDLLSFNLYDQDITLDSKIKTIIKFFLIKN